LGKSYVPKLPKAVIEYEVRDKNGKLLSKGRFPAKSWVGNIVCFLSDLLKGGTTSSTSTSLYYATTRTDLVDTVNTARGFSIVSGVGSTLFGAEGGVGDVGAGIVVGSGDTPVNLGQYALASLITHGTGSGQLSYGTTTVETLTKDTAWYFRVIRTFTNNSGGSVTVKEIGLYVRLWLRESPYYYSCMFARDVLPAPVTVPNGSTLTVRYIISHSLA
jgi:hypothetical protein